MKQRRNIKSEHNAPGQKMIRKKEIDERKKEGASEHL
jgi:hypothetical protein